ncbi:MAG: 50S ribosomal protein L3 [Chloroflexota bacterium]|nr:50S ribosomal protein L3 [Chloroflexota bacterium]
MIKGILGRKIGMTQIFEPNGTATGVTVLQAGPCTVTQVKTPDTDGYSAVQIGFEELTGRQERKITEPQKGHLRKNKLPLLRHLREMEVGGDDAGSHNVGDVIDVTMFVVGEIVDVIGISKGKGFAGVVKRYHFAGGPKTHGQSDRHRRPGSIGAGTTPGRVYKGMRMAGRMGNDRVTVQNLRIVQIDTERNLIVVRGAVPGAANSLITVRKAIKGKQ